jgi:alkylhydroperoxidase/carboxymuconolactone decarboxylase family protein YurZ
MLDERTDESELTVADLQQIAADLLIGVADGDPLDGLTATMVSFGLAASVTALDRVAMEATLERALAAGASIPQLQEIVSLVSGLGVHSLMGTATSLQRQAQATGAVSDGPLDEREQALWDRYVGADPFWAGFEAELPGFLEAMLRLSSDQFVAFFDYCAVPWKSGTVRARCKELVAMACDATPTHRFLPGFRLHLRNAIALGVGRRAILDTLALAAAAPVHRGTR